MAIKEYRVQQANMRPIYRRHVPLVRDLVGDKTATKEAARLPLAEGQSPIAQQSRSPRYDEGSIMGLISSLRSPGEANPTFDPAKPIGGENVPYQGTSGVGGLFSRIFGNRANELNVEAQQQQAAEKKAEDILAKERLAKREDLAEEIRLREEGPTKRFEAEQKRLKDKEIRDEIAREDAINLQLAREGEKDVLSDVDMARREARDAEERALKTRELDIKESALKPPRYSPIGNSGLFQTPEGELGVFEPGTPSFGTMKGTPPRIRMMTGQVTKAPAASGGAQVDRATGATLGGSQLPPGGGVLAPGGTAATMGAAQPSAQPRYATLSDRLLALPGMGAIFDMPRVMTPERTARLAESRSLQDAENRERIRRMQEEAGRDIGPSMF